MALMRSSTVASRIGEINARVSAEVPGRCPRRLSHGNCGSKPDERVIRIERLRLEKDEPILYCLDYIPRSLATARLDEIDWSGSLLDRHSQRPRMSSASVTSVMLPPDVIERNELQNFGPALLIVETCFSPAGVSVIYAIDYHRGSHFSFSLVRK